MKQALQRFIRNAHLVACNRGLPDRVAVLFHYMPEETWTDFREFVSFFRERGYRFSDPEDFLYGADGPRVYISFDDNYRCWHDALGLFDDLDVRVTFYVNAAPCRDRATPNEVSAYYDRLHFHGDRTPLTVTELRELAAAGHTIGSHTFSHHVLTDLATHDAVEEIEKGKRAIESILGANVEHFSYPYGMRRHFNDGLKSYCREIGCTTIATAIAGLQHHVNGSYEIHRTVWHLDRALDYNIANLSVDGRLWERLTGRNAVI